MPVQKSKSKLVAKLGSEGRELFNKHKADPITLSGGGDLPAGIEGGVARLTKSFVDTYKKGDNTGDYCLKFSAVVVQPVEFTKQRIEGAQFHKTLPLCETSYSDFESNLSKALNELNKLGGSTEEIELDDLESIVEGLQETQPYFRFRTWQGGATKEYPNPRVNVDWRGFCDYEEDADAAENAVEDETVDENDPEALGAAADSGDQDAQAKLTEAAIAADVDPEEFDTWASVAEAVQAAASAPKKTKGPKKAKPAPVVEEEEEAEEEEDNSDISLQDLGSLADDDADEDAMEKLSQAAAEAELDPDDYETWLALAEALVEARSAAEGEAEEEEEWKPEKSEVYFYKTNPKAKKSAECEVLAVFEAKKLVNLKCLDDDKVYKAVPWSALENN